MNEKLLKLLLILLVCIPMASTDIFTPALPIMVEQLHTDPTTIGLTLSGYMLGFSISMLTSGSLSDMYGRRRVLIFSMTIYITSCFLIIFSHNIYHLILLRLFQGLGGGSGTVVGRLILKDHYKASQQISMMSTLSTGMAIALAIAPQIGAWCTHYINWQSCFTVTFLLGCFILWVLIFKFKETNTNLSSDNPIKQLPLSFIRAFNSKEFTGFTLIIAFAWSAYFSYIGLSSFLFQDIYLYSENQYACMMAAVTIGYLLGTTFTNYLNKRNVSIYNILKLGIYACLSTTVILLVGFIVHNSWLVIFAIFVLRFGIGLIMPSAQVGAMRFHTQNTGWYMGCLFFVEFILGSLTLYLASFLELVQTGLGMLIAIIASIILLLLGFNFIKNNP